MSAIGQTIKGAWNNGEDTIDNVDIYSALQGSVLGATFAGAMRFAAGLAESDAKKIEIVCDLVDAGCAMLAGGLAATVVALPAALIIPVVDAGLKNRIRKWMSGPNLSEFVKKACGTKGLANLNRSLLRKEPWDYRLANDYMNEFMKFAG